MCPIRSLDKVHDRLREFLEMQAMTGKLEEFMVRMRDDSEWCVKPKYQHLLIIPSPDQCDTL